MGSVPLDCPTIGLQAIHPTVENLMEPPRPLLQKNENEE
jgi:hypothetical protein